MPDATGAAAEGLDRLQRDVDGIQHVVLACERGVEGLTAAVAAGSVPPFRHSRGGDDGAPVCIPLAQLRSTDVDE
eukprot:91300-Lingulodinium_polyedra.AAC.1